MGRLKNWRKYAPDIFVQNIENMSTEELKEAILESAEMISRTNDEKDDDLTLTDLEEKANDLRGGYRDTVRAYQSKILGALEVLKARGIAISPKLGH